MKNMPRLILISLVVLGIIGIMMVMKAETTAHISYTTFERPSVFLRPLTTTPCESVQTNPNLGEAQCISQGKWECQKKYPLTPGGATNACLDICVRDVYDQCMR
jgi:hypothetical protein